MAKIRNKQDIIDEIKSFELVLDNTYRKGHESFLLMCDAVTVNDICFRDVREVHFVDNTMWVDNASIEVGDVKKFYISFTTIRYDVETLELKAKAKKGFKQK